MLEKLAPLLVEVSDLLKDDLFQGMWQIAGFERLDHPFLTREAHPAIRHEFTDDLSQEERVSLGDASQIALERLGRLQDRENAVQVFQYAALAERAKLDPLDSQLLLVC